MPPPYLDREDREYIPKNVSSGWTDYDRSFPTQDMADRFDYGYAQMWNPQGGARDVGPWLEEDDYYNPDVFERQMGLASFPGAAKKYAQLSNQGFYNPIHFDSPSQLRNLLGYAQAMNADPSLQNSMYADLYGPDDPNPPNYTPEMYTSKREQIEDEENTFVKMMMENYGRDNPLLPEMGGMETTEVTSPRGDVTTTEEYIDDGYNLRDLEEIRYGHKSNLDSNNWPYGVRPPSGRPGGMDFIPEEIIEPSFPNTPEPEITFPNTPPPGWEPEPPLGPPYRDEEYWDDYVGGPPPVSLVNKPRNYPNSARNWIPGSNIGHYSAKAKHWKGRQEAFEEGLKKYLQGKRRTQSRIAQRTTPRSTSSVEDPWWKIW